MTMSRRPAMVMCFIGCLFMVSPTMSQAIQVASTTISLSTASAEPGDKVGIQGQDSKPVFAGCVLTVVTNDGKVLDNDLIAGSCSNSEVGRISGSFIVPVDLTSTGLQVNVCVSSCLTSEPPEPPASGSLSITPAAADSVDAVESAITITPASVQPGGQLAITGTGPASETDLDCGVRVHRDGSQTVLDSGDIGGTCLISASGSITASFTAPTGLDPGEMQVDVFCTQACGDDAGVGWSASGSFQLESVGADTSISVKPDRATPGSEVFVNGTGPPSADEGGCVLTVMADGADAPLTDDTGTCSIDADGVISGSWTVPADLGPGNVKVSACVASCLVADNPAAPATAALEIVSLPIVLGRISVHPNPAKPGETVTITGSGPETADPGSCQVALDDATVDASCSVDSAGGITGSFSVPADFQPRGATVKVCQPDCDAGPKWTASASLDVAPAADPTDPTSPTDSAGTSAATTAAPDDRVVTPDLGSLDLQDTEDTLKGAGLGLKTAGDVNGWVSKQIPTAGEKVPPGTIVLATFSTALAPPGINWVLLITVAVSVLIIAGAAWGIRHRTWGRTKPSLTDTPMFVVNPGVPHYRTQPIDPGSTDTDTDTDVDVDVDLVLISLHETTTILEVQP